MNYHGHLSREDTLGRPLVASRSSEWTLPSEDVCLPPSTHNPPVLGAGGGFLHWPQVSCVSRKQSSRLLLVVKALALHAERGRRRQQNENRRITQGNIELGHFVSDAFVVSVEFRHSRSQLPVG